MLGEEHYLCGYVQSAEHRENVRIAAILRESTIRRKVSARGVVYDNITRAAKGTGLSARCVARYAGSNKHDDFFFVEVSNG